MYLSGVFSLLGKLKGAGDFWILSFKPIDYYLLGDLS